PGRPRRRRAAPSKAAAGARVRGVRGRGARVRPPRRRPGRAPGCPGAGLGAAGPSRSIGPAPVRLSPGHPRGGPPRPGHPGPAAHPPGPGLALLVTFVGTARCAPSATSPPQAPGAPRPGRPGTAAAGPSAAQIPPETVMSLPVTNDASGETSHDTASAISPGRPIRPSGLCSAASCATWYAISVSMMPGETLLTRIPSAATSLDRPRAKVTRAPLVASYGTAPIAQAGAWAANAA